MLFCLIIYLPLEHIPKNKQTNSRLVTLNHPSKEVDSTSTTTPMLMLPTTTVTTARKDNQPVVQAKTLPQSIDGQVSSSSLTGTSVCKEAPFERKLEAAIEELELSPRAPQSRGGDKQPGSLSLSKKRNSDTLAACPVTVIETPMLSRHESTRRRRPGEQAGGTSGSTQLQQPQHQRLNAVATLSVNSLGSRNNSIFSTCGKLPLPIL